MSPPASSCHSLFSSYLAPGALFQKLLSTHVDEGQNSNQIISVYFNFGWNLHHLFSTPQRDIIWFDLLQLNGDDRRWVRTHFFFVIFHFVNFEKFVWFLFSLHSCVLSYMIDSFYHLAERLTCSLCLTGVKEEKLISGRKPALWKKGVDLDVWGVFFPKKWTSPLTPHRILSDFLLVCLCFSPLLSLITQMKLKN